MNTESFQGKIEWKNGLHCSELSTLTRHMDGDFVTGYGGFYTLSTKTATNTLNCVILELTLCILHKITLIFKVQ